jgi:hypothetical protein
MVQTLSLGTLLLALGTGCVSKAEFERQMELGAARERDLQSKSAAAIGAAESQLAALKADNGKLKEELDSRDRQVGDA